MLPNFFSKKSYSFQYFFILLKSKVIYFFTVEKNNTVKATFMMGITKTIHVSQYTEPTGFIPIEMCGMVLPFI